MSEECSPVTPDWDRLAHELARALSGRVPPTEIQDIVQEALATLLARKLAGADVPNEQIFAMAWKIARDRCIDWHRRQARRAPRPGDLPARAPFAPPEPDPDAGDRPLEACFEGIRAAAHELLPMLARRQARLLQWYLEHGPAAAHEVGAALGISTTDVWEVARAIGRKYRLLRPPPRAV